MPLFPKHRVFLIHQAFHDESQVVRHLDDGHARGEDIFPRVNADVVHPKNLLSTLLHVIKDHGTQEPLKELND